MTMNVWYFEDLRRFSYRYISAILLLGSRRIPISEIVGSRSGIEPWLLALKAKSLTTTPPLLHMTMKDGQKTFASFYPCQFVQTKNQGVFVKHYGMPRRQLS